MVPLACFLLRTRLTLVVLPHIVVGSAFLIRIGVVRVAMLATLPEIVLSVCNTVATSPSSAICSVL
jgi:hypothetical protein